MIKEWLDVVNSEQWIVNNNWKLRVENWELVSYSELVSVSKKDPGSTAGMTKRLSVIM